jgi:excisionase family DNA binding protein
MSPVLAELARAVAAALDDAHFAAAVEHHRRSPVSVLSSPLLTADDVAALLGIPVVTVRQFAREERLPCRRIGRHVRFVRAEVERAALDGRLAA